MEHSVEDVDDPFLVRQGSGMKTHELIGDYATTDQKFREQDEIAEYIFGMVARRNDQPMDRTKSPAWQHGWASAQE
jgi:hypothetical protein